LGIGKAHLYLQLLPNLLGIHTIYDQLIQGTTLPGFLILLGVIIQRFQDFIFDYFEFFFLNTVDSKTRVIFHSFSGNLQINLTSKNPLALLPGFSRVLECFPGIYHRVFSTFFI
jgi:hypothetical protein